MPEGADVVIRYEFLPTDASIKQSAERVVKQVNQRFSSVKLEKGGDLSPEVKKVVNSQKKAIKSMDDFFINLFRLMSPRVQMATKLISYRKLTSGGIPGGGKVAKEATAGAEVGEAGAEGAAAGGGIGSLVGMLAGISVAVLLISGFFEAVGPFLKVLVKIIGAFFLILLAPLIRALAPNLRGMIKVLMDFGKWLAGGLTWLIGAIGEFLKDPIGGLMKLGGWLLDLIGKAVKWGLAWFMKPLEVVDKALKDLKYYFTDQKTGGLDQSKVAGFSLGMASGAVLPGSGGAVMNFFRMLDLTWKLLTYKPPTSTFSGGGGGGFAGDFISRPGMGVQKFSPDDTVIGTKGGMGASGGITINNTFNVDASVDKTQLMDIFNKFSRQQARDIRMKTSYAGGFYA